jgi:hypothetical protein
MSFTAATRLTAPPKTAYGSAPSPFTGSFSFSVASGGPVSLAREKPGKERGGAPPLHPGAQGAEAKGT